MEKLEASEKSGAFCFVGDKLYLCQNLTFIFKVKNA